MPFARAKKLYFSSYFKKCISWRGTGSKIIELDKMYAFGHRTRLEKSPSLALWKNIGISEVGNHGNFGSSRIKQNFRKSTSKRGTSYKSTRGPKVGPDVSYFFIY